MNLDFIDIRSLTAIRNSISEITDLSFSIYDSMGGLLSQPDNEDKLLAKIKAYDTGREEYETFIRKGISKSSIRNDASILKGPADQHYVFIPVRINNFMLILISRPFYLELNDLENFIAKNGPRFGLSFSNAETWKGIVKIKDYPSVQKIISPVKFLFETILKSGYEKNLNHKRYQWTKTLIDVLFNIQLPIPNEELYSLVLDAILFQFNVDTASIMIKDKDRYKTAAALGKLQNEVGSLCIKDNTFISQAVESSRLASTNDILEISMLGFPESIASVQVFPRLCSDDICGAVFIFNSVISREESYSILEFLKLASLILKNLSLQNSYDKCLNSIEVLNTASSRLNPALYNTETLYDSIVDTATEITKAEKGSLMLPEKDDLSIKAVKGINKWLLQDIKIKKGEGVAGKVFNDGTPLLYKNGDTIKNLNTKYRHHYKTDSFVSVPLKFDTEKLGVINVTDKTTGDEFTELDLNVLNYFASYASIALKVSSYHNMAEYLKELSITDPLTQIFNRRYLQERFTEEIYRSERHNLAFSFIIFDIDNFKLFNDTEGHLAGDNILREVAKTAHAGSRVHDVICRLGGEEFAILMPQTNRDEAFLVAERIRKNVKDSLTAKWDKFPHSSITISLGISTFPDDGETVNELIKSADTALYKAKALGKDKTVINGKKA